MLSEADMLRELRAHGPFLLDFDALPTFAVYKSGILEDKSAT